MKIEAIKGNTFTFFSNTGSCLGPEGSFGAYTNWNLGHNLVFLRAPQSQDKYISPFQMFKFKAHFIRNNLEGFLSISYES